MLHLSDALKVHCDQPPLVGEPIHQVLHLPDALGIHYDANEGANTRERIHWRIHANVFSPLFDSTMVLRILILTML